MLNDDGMRYELNVQMDVILLLNSFSEQPGLSFCQMNDATQAVARIRRRHFHLYNHRYAVDLTT